MKYQFISNLSWNLLSLLVSIGVNIWMVPYIIKHIGIEAYGFVPLTQQIVNYFTIITIAVTSVLGRFMLLAISNGDNYRANEYFNSALVVALWIIGIVTILISLMTCYLNYLIVIPNELLWDVQLSFLLNAAVFLFSFLNSIFGVIFFVKNRLDYNSSISIFSQFIRAITIISLLTFLLPHIWHISFASIMASAVSSVVTIVAFKRMPSNISIKLSSYNVERLKELLSTGSWVSINWVGSILFLQIDLLVANWLVGPKISGEYAALLQFSIVLRMLSGSIASVFSPRLVSIYSTGDIEQLTKYAKQAVRITGFLMAVPIGIVCGLSQSLLYVWLGSSFVSLSWLLVLLTFHLVFNLAVQPLFALQTAMIHLKYPAIITIILGVVNFLVALLLGYHYGIWGIATAGAIVLTAKNIIFTPIYTAMKLRKSTNIFLKEIGYSVVIMVFVSAMTYSTHYIWHIDSWYKLMIVVSLVCLLFGGFGLIFGRQYLKQYFHKN